jgi:hypothetical protein
MNIPRCCSIAAFISERAARGELAAARGSLLRNSHERAETMKHRAYVLPAALIAGLATAPLAHAEWHGRGHWHHHGGGDGNAVGAAIAGGLLGFGLGAAVASGGYAPYYYAPPPVYYGSVPYNYYAPPPAVYYGYYR